IRNSWAGWDASSTSTRSTTASTSISRASIATNAAIATASKLGGVMRFGTEIVSRRAALRLAPRQAAVLAAAVVALAYATAGGIPAGPARDRAGHADSDIRHKPG